MGSASSLEIVFGIPAALFILFALAILWKHRHRLTGRRYEMRYAPFRRKERRTSYH